MNLKEENIELKWRIRQQEIIIKELEAEIKNIRMWYKGDKERIKEIQRKILEVITNEERIR